MRPARSRTWLAITAAAAAFCAVFWWQRGEITPLLVASAPSLASHIPGVGEPPSGAQAPAPIPVTSAEARRADFPVLLDGLGTVEPYDTVMVRSRVDGQIVKVLFEQGQMVKEGDPLVEIDKRPFQAALDQAAAKKAQDEATLKDAELDLQRYATLAQQSFSSRQQLDAQQALVDQLKAEIRGDQASIDNATTQLDYTTIKSPLTGRAGFRLIDPGNIVHATDQGGIVTIVRLQPIYVQFTAPEGALSEVKAALASNDAPVDALSTDGRTVLSHGHLALVDNTVDAASGTIGLKASFANAENGLWPGQSVATRMRTTLLKGVTVIPQDGVQHGPDGLFAYVIGSDNHASLQRIEVGQTGSAGAVVTAGLSPGEKVVVEGQYRLQPGSLVEARPALSPNPTDEISEADPIVAGRVQ